MLCKIIHRIQIRKEKAENHIGKWLILNFKFKSLAKYVLKFFTNLINIMMNYLYINLDILKNELYKKHKNIFQVLKLNKL